MPSRRQSSAMVASPRRPSRTMRIFSSAEYCLRVARRMSRTSRSDGVSGVLDLCLMSTPQVVTMSPKSSVPQAASFVSQVLMSDRRKKKKRSFSRPRLARARWACGGPRVGRLISRSSTSSAVFWMRSPSRNFFAFGKRSTVSTQPVDELEVRLDGGACTACVVGHLPMLRRRRPRRRACARIVPDIHGSAGLGVAKIPVRLRRNGFRLRRAIFDGTRHEPWPGEG